MESSNCCFGCKNSLIPIHRLGKMFPQYRGDYVSTALLLIFSLCIILGGFLLALSSVFHPVATIVLTMFMITLGVSFLSQVVMKYRKLRSDKVMYLKLISHNTRDKYDSVLRQVSEDVTEINSDIRSLVFDMRAMLKFQDYSGLSAPQLGRNLNIFVLGLEEVMVTTQHGQPLEKPMKTLVRLDTPRVFINPYILESSREVVSGIEGCGSELLGKTQFEISRAKDITIRAYDLEGKRFTYTTSSPFITRAILHEMDHLKGVLPSDYLQAAEGDEEEKNQRIQNHNVALDKHFLELNEILNANNQD